MLSRSLKKCWMRQWYLKIVYFYVEINCSAWQWAQAKPTINEAKDRIDQQLIKLLSFRDISQKNATLVHPDNGFLTLPSNGVTGISNVRSSVPFSFTYCSVVLPVRFSFSTRLVRMNLAWRCFGNMIQTQGNQHGYRSNDRHSLWHARRIYISCCCEWPWNSWCVFVAFVYCCFVRMSGLNDEQKAKGWRSLCSFCNISITSNKHLHIGM